MGRGYFNIDSALSIARLARVSIATDSAFSTSLMGRGRAPTLSALLFEAMTNAPWGSRIARHGSHRRGGIVSILYRTAPY